MALALYRRVLRVARTWEGPAHEKAWIREEARRKMEEHRSQRDPRVIQELIQQAHNDVDVALHYKIPYPRPHYVDPGTVGGDTDFRRLSARSNTKLSRGLRSSMSKRFQPKR
ncbi:TPA: hypothetical protein N0F65_009289 [Lagenidium giganteum]|uniref:Complex 1 LYR protein domain-containing protein n=1 Tax=Lagenidium giganteum TaxID=4803 RepID=A0AAV2YQC8_9STRA|nr:TPA: hypothetical protein N0F65_009289 [Lagenidium giganteum]